MTDDRTEPPAIDLQRVLLELDEEVKAKRASGEISAELERELDMTFARFAPAGALEGDFEQLIERAESQAFFDLLAPNESARPVVPHVKRVVQKTMRWYLRYVVEQVTGFAHTITKAVRQLGERVEGIEQLAGSPDSFDSVRALIDDEATDTWSEAVLGQMKFAQGRVLHLGCGRGELVRALQGSGVDAYGVESVQDMVTVGMTEAPVVDLRPDAPLEHLAKLAPSSLGGIVVSDVTNGMPAGARLKMLDRIAEILPKGAPIAIVATNPRAWESGVESVVAADLAPGRPFHAETWKFLLEQHGCTEIEIQDEANSKALSVEGISDTALQSVLAANFDKLNAELFPPKSSLVLARR